MALAAIIYVLYAFVRAHHDFDPVLKDPYIDVKGIKLPFDGTPLRIPVKFSNPKLQSLGTFFVSPYDLEATIL